MFCSFEANTSLWSIQLLLFFWSEKRNEHCSLTGGIYQTVAVYDFSLDSNTNTLSKQSQLSNSHP